MCLGILSALYHREKSGQGQKIEISMQEANLGFMTAVLHTHFEGRQVSCPPKACADGYFYFHVPDMTDQLWRALTSALGHAEFSSDPRFATESDRRRNYNLVEAAVADMVKDKTRAQLWDVLSACGLSSAPVLSMAECLADRHLNERNAFIELDHPEAGPVKVPAPWIRLSGTRRPSLVPRP